MSEPATVHSVLTIIRRLSAYVAAETSEISGNAKFDFQASSERKSRMLIELSRASRSINPAQVDQTLAQELEKLKEALQENERRIKAHLASVREVSALMVNILKNEEADGTYQEF